MRRGLFIGLIVFAFIVGIIWAIGNRGGDDPVQEGAVEETALIDYANTTNNVRYIMRGKINAREEHRVLTITVGRDSRVATITEGYSGKVIKSQRLGNDSNAYEEFLAALENEGFTQARQAESSIVPEGACPKGRRFDFEIYRLAIQNNHSGQLLAGVQAVPLTVAMMILVIYLKHSCLSTAILLKAYVSN